MDALVVGAFGAGIVLVAFLLELFEHVSPENQWFLFANAVGSAFLLWYAWLLNNVVFMTINAVWLLGSLYEWWRVRY